MPATFSIATAISPLHEEEAVSGTLASLRDALAALGGQVAEAPQAPADAPLVHLVLTGGTEQIVLDRVAARREAGVREPVLLVAHPARNSLPAALEILARVRRDGGGGQVLFLESPEDAAGLEGLRKAVRLAGVAMQLRRARLGAFGAPSTWLVASAHPADVVAASWGVQVVPFPMLTVDERPRLSAADEQLARELRAGARACAPDQEALGKSAAVAHALDEAVAAHRLDAVTVRCFDLLDRGATGCVAVSRLADRGIPAGCEGDIPSAVALLWVQILAGEPGWMANPARISVDKGEIVLAHCTIPRTLVGSFSLDTHFESGRGVSLAGDLAPGPVTLLRIGGARLEQLWCCEGWMVQSLRDSSLCRTQVRVEAPPEALAQLLEAPLGNHVVLVRGRREAELRASRRFVLGTGGGNGS